MNQIIENKKEDMKSFKKFILIVILGGIIGGFIGFGSNYIDVNAVHLIGANVSSFLVYAIPAFLVVMNAFVLVINLLLTKQAKRGLNIWDGEDENLAKQIEHKIDMCMILISILMILNFMLFAVGMGLIFRAEYLSGKQFGILSLVIIISFVFGNVGIIACQKIGVDIIKKMNPEKEGSIFDTKFADKWEASCDEAQKIVIYKSAYKAYKNVSMCCAFLWIIATLGDLIFQTGFLPVILVTVIWLVQALSYMLESMKLEK